MKLRLPLLLATAVMACYSHVSADTATGFSVNFVSVNGNPISGTEEIGVVGSDFTVQADNWNNITPSVANQWYNVMKDNSGAALSGLRIASTRAISTWTAGVKETETDKLLSNYIDTNSTTAYTVTIAGVPYISSTVYIIMSGDGGTFTAMNVNGTDWTSDGTNTVEGNTPWGNRAASQGALTPGTNTLVVEGVIGGTIKIGNVLSGSARGTMAGLQVVDSYQGTYRYRLVEADGNWNGNVWGSNATDPGTNAWSGTREAAVLYSSATENSSYTLSLGNGQVHADGIILMQGNLTLDSGTLVLENEKVITVQQGAALTLGENLTLENFNNAFGGWGTIYYNILGTSYSLKDLTFEGAIIFGDDKEVTLTDSAQAGLLQTGDGKLNLGASGTYGVNGFALTIGENACSGLTANAADQSLTLSASSTASITGLTVSGGKLVIPGDISLSVFNVADNCEFTLAGTGTLSVPGGKTWTGVTSHFGDGTGLLFDSDLTFRTTASTISGGADSLGITVNGKTSLFTTLTVSGKLTTNTMETNGSGAVGTLEVVQGGYVHFLEQIQLTNYSLGNSHFNLNISGGTVVSDKNLTMSNDGYSIITLTAGELTVNGLKVGRNRMLTGNMDNGGKSNVVNLGDSENGWAGSGVLTIGEGGLYGIEAGFKKGDIDFAASAVNLGQGTVKASADWETASSSQVSGSGNVTLHMMSTAGTTFDTNGYTITLNHGLDGAGKLIKTGGGTLVLNNLAAHEGGTELKGGSLNIVNGKVAGNITADGSSTLIAAATSFLSSGSMTLNGATLDWRNGYFTKAYDFITATGGSTDNSLILTLSKEPVSLLGTADQFQAHFSSVKLAVGDRLEAGDYVLGGGLTTADLYKNGASLGLLNNGESVAADSYTTLTLNDNTIQVSLNTTALEADGYQTITWYDQSWGSQNPPGYAVPESLTASFSLSGQTDAKYFYTDSTGSASAAVVITDATGNNLILAGGRLSDGSGATDKTVTITKNVWMDVRGGAFQMIVGANVNSWGTGENRPFVGDTHVQLIGDTTANLVMGMGPAFGASMTGSSYIYIGENAQILNGSGGYLSHMNGNVYGGGYSPDNVSVNFTGDTHITIANVQTTAGNVFGGSTMKNTASALIHGGSTYITVDLEAGQSGIFAKNIYGGSHIGAEGGGSPNLTINGDGNISVTAPADVTFSGVIAGGGLISGGGSANAQVNVLGDTHVTIDGGTYNNLVIGGGHKSGGNGTVSVGGNTNVTIKSGTFSNVIYGGGSGAGATVAGNTNIVVTGISSSNRIFGGGNLISVGGNTSVSVSGSTDKRLIIVGGSQLASGSTDVGVTGNTNVVFGEAYGAGTDLDAVDATNQVMRIFGAGLYGVVSGDSTVTFKSGTLVGELDGSGVPLTGVGADLAGGGWAGGVTGNTTLNLEGGTIDMNAARLIVGGSAEHDRGVGGSTHVLIGKDLLVKNNNAIYGGNYGNGTIGAGTNVTISGVAAGDRFYDYTGTIYGGSAGTGTVTGDKVLNLDNVSALQAKFSGFDTMNVKGGAGTTSVVSLGSSTVHVVTSGRILSVALASDESIASLSGAGSLLLTGGTLAVTGASDSTGGITVQGTGSVLKAQGASSVGKGSVMLSNGGTLLFSSTAFDVMEAASKITIGGTDAASSKGTLMWDGTGNDKDISGLLDIAADKELTLDTNGNAVTLSEIISSGNFVKTGAGTLTMSGASTYAGTTTVSDGTLKAGHVSGFGTGTVVLAGGTLDLDGKAAANGVTVSGTAVLNGGSAYAGVLTLDGGTLTGDAVNLAEGKTAQLKSGSIANVLSGTGGVAKIGDGSSTVTLSGENTYSGKTSVSGGTLKAGHLKAFGESTVELSGGTLEMDALAIANDVQAIGTATLNGGSAYAGVITLDGGTLSGSGINLAQAMQLKSGTINNALSGTAGVVKTGAGTVNLTGAITYQGDTVISGGTLAYTGAGQLTLHNITISGNSSVLSAGNLSMANGAVITLKMDGREEGDDPFISLSGTYTPNSAKTLVLDGYENLAAGTYKLFAGDNTLSSSDFSWHYAMDPNKAYMLSIVDHVLLISVSNVIAWTWNGTEGDTWSGFSPDHHEWILGEGGSPADRGPDGQEVCFIGNNTYQGIRTVDIDGTVLPSSVTVANESGDANNFTFISNNNGGIGGDDVFLSKSGAGLLTIDPSVRNTYAGGSRLFGGIVSVSTSDALGTGMIDFLGGSLETTASIVLSNRIGNDLPPGIYQDLSSIKLLPAAGTTLTIDNTRTSDTEWNGFQFVSQSNGDLLNSCDLEIGSATSTGAVRLTNLVNEALFGGTVSIASGASLELSNAVSGGEVIVSSPLAGIAGTLSKTDDGNLLLRALFEADSVSGTISALSGTIKISSYGITGVTDRIVTVDGTLAANNLTIFGAAETAVTTDHADHSANISVSGTLTLGGEGTVGTLRISGGRVDASGIALSGSSVFELTGGTLNLGAGGFAGTDGTVTLGNGTLASAEGWSSAHDLVLAGTGATGTTLSNAETVTLSGALSGSGVMTKSGAGSLVLSGTNEGDTQWDGTLTVTEGVVELGSASALAKGGLVVDGDSASADLGGLGIANAITIKNGSLTRASGYVSDSNVSILAHEGVAGIDLGGLKASAIASILVPVKTDISPYRATTISGIGSGNLTLEGPTTLMLGENNYVPGSSGRADGVIVFGSDAGASAAGHDVSLGSLTLGLTLDLQKSISRNNLEGTTVLLQLTNGRLVADAPQTHSATFNGYSDLSEGSLAWLKSIRFNPLLQYLGYAVKTVDISQAQFDSYLSDGQVAITAGGDVYFASDDKGQLNAGTHYNYLDAYKAVVIDEDLDISLSGAPAAGSGHPAGLKVENLLGGLGEDGTVYTITVANADPGAGAAKINFVNGLNSEGEKLDTVYDGNIAGGSADFIKTGAAGLTINGSFSTSGTVTTSEGTLTLNGTSSFGTLDTGKEGSMTVIGGTGKIESLKGSGALSLSGEASRLTLTGAGNTVLDTQVTGSGTLDMAGGTLLVGTGSLSSDTTLNLQEHAGLYIGGGETIEMGYLTGPGTVDFQGVDAAPAVLKLTGNGEGTISFAMEGRGTLAKAGTGTQTLAMSNDSLSLDVQGGRLVVDIPSGTASYGHLAVNDGAELVLKNNAKSSGLLVHGGGSLVLGTSDPASTVGHMKLDISGNAAFGEGSLLTTVAAPGIDNTSVSATGTVTLPERMSLRFINHDSEGWNAPLSDLVVMDATGGFLNVSGQTLGSGTDFTDWTVTFEKSISLFYTSADLSIGHDGRQLLATPVLNKVNTLDQYAGSETAKAGAGLIWNAGLQKSGSNLDSLLSSIMDDIKTGNDSSASHKMAAAAGSTVTSLLGAQQADYRYQQTLLRNRMTTMGLPEGYNYDGELPLWNAWVQATGTYNSLTESGDFAGYKYNTWGGTFGVDTNLSERLTVGLAMSASYGKLTSNGADTLSGDLDIYYANLFARYQKGKWGHNFIVTAGWSDGTVDRTVNYGEGSYTGHGSTSGSTYGAMYEATYDIALNEENNAIFQPLVNVSVMRNEVDDYNETGAGNAGLRVSGLEGTSATVSVGGRLMGIIGGNVFGRESLGELRVQVAQDLGDTRSEGNVGFLSNPGFSQQVKGSKAGTTGLQFGAGLSLPSGENGTIFVDATADIRSRMTSASGSIGYRYNF